MSFGPTSDTRNAMTASRGVADTAMKAQGTEAGQAGNLLNMGGQNLQSGTNFFNTLLNGNQGNTTAMLQPDINRIRGANQNTLQAVSTLMPRGGGRSSTLFNAAYQPNEQIQNLFNGARSGAAGNLAAIGQGQQGLGANLFGISNQPLGTAGSVNQGLAQTGLQQQQLTNSLWSNLGAGLFGLATTPFGGGSASGGLLGMLPSFGGKG